jgi:hypothetical protein
MELELTWEEPSTVDYYGQDKHKTPETLAALTWTETSEGFP